MSEFPQNRSILWSICTAGQDVKQKIEGEIVMKKNSNMHENRHARNA